MIKEDSGKQCKGIKGGSAIVTKAWEQSWMRALVLRRRRPSLLGPVPNRLRPKLPHPRTRSGSDPSSSLEASSRPACKWQEGRTQVRRKEGERGRACARRTHAHA